MSPGSAQQRLTTISALLAFFRANVGNATDPDFNRNFNPWWGIPPTVTDENGAVQPYPTRADRGFTPPVPITVFEDFTGPTGTSSYGFPNQSSNITISHGRVPNHDASLRGGSISWTTAGPNTFFQTNWTAAGSGTNISSYTTLELRVSRQNNSLNPSTPTDFTIRLMGAAGVGGIGSMSGSLKLSTYIDPNFAGTSGHQSYLQGPVGSTAGGPHPILQTVRIPLADFPGWQLVSRSVHGIRLTFDQTGQGAIYVANIRLSTSPVNLAEPRGTEDLVEELQQSDRPVAPSVLLHTGVITAVSHQPSLWQRNGAPGVEIEIASPDIFPVRDSLLTLNIGSRYFTTSRYATDDLHRVVFSLTAEEFASLPAGAAVIVQYGERTRGDIWNCGKLN